MHRYDNLKVWQQSIRITRDVYRLTAALPREERFGLTSQMRRASTSIPSNIAEGAAYQSRKEFDRFLRIALGSAHELDTQLVIADVVGLAVNDAVASIRADLKEVRAMLVGLRRYVSEQRL